MHFTLISEFNTPVAILCDAPPNPGQRSILLGLIRGDAYQAPVLAARWEVAQVLCTNEWAEQQLQRKPMLRPSGHRLAFLASIFMSLIFLSANAATQGDAAQNLLHQSAAPSPIGYRPSAIGASPLSLLPPPPPDTNYAAIYYLTATAVDDAGLESDYADELIYLNTSHAHEITLAWDECSGTNCIADYRIYKGRAPKTYTNVFSAGPNTSLTIPLYTTGPTNLLITVTTPAPCLLSAPTPTGPWTGLPTATLTLTNPSAPCYYRGLGCPDPVTITKTRF